ncbi:hypothetical protein SAMN04488028_10252 [Reichenbachiella agariperforans]|uniref:Uncharacterized protein n=1 Tax=Reichenbachiella agariperforans TaxID=156994 RepID=A0A1M6N1G4_REIAG|nr:hypothetical protein [Reichenbachiella agariperforans]SHJ89466.1 hypothetical protein SAMN04488028_10252 [Reichenbachiella agariperforans]
MQFQSNSLDIFSSPEHGIHVLYFRFKGKFTKQESTAGSRAWSEELESSNNSYRFIWDCSEMTGFEPSARTEWYKSMKLYKGRISDVTVISSSILIRGAARVMLEMFGLKSYIVKSTADILVR